MSAISHQVEPALYAKLNVSGVTSLATGGVHNETTTASLPYVIFNRQAAKEPVRTYGGIALEDDIWLIKAFADENSHATKSARRLISEILIAAETAIGSSLTLGSGATLKVERLADVVIGAQERESDKPVFGGGFMLTVMARP